MLAAANTERKQETKPKIVAAERNPHTPKKALRTEKHTD